jgi:hypothetical protein
MFALNVVRPRGFMALGALVGGDKGNLPQVLKS